MKAKIKRIALNPEHLAAILATGATTVIEAGIPENSRIVGMAMDPNTGKLNVFIQNESFAEVESSVKAPLLETKLSVSKT